MAVLQRQGSVQRRASQGQYEDEQAKHFHPIVQKWKRQGLRIINLLNQKQENAGLKRMPLVIWQ